jgi:hypothetical protein
MVSSWPELNGRLATVVERLHPVFSQIVKSPSFTDASEVMLQEASPVE